MKVHRNRILNLNFDAFGHFLLETISLMKYEEVVEMGSNEEYEVRLTINGVELPVEEVFMHWHNKLESSVEYRAEQLFAEKFRDVKDILSNLSEVIGDKMNDAKLEICNKLNLEYFHDD